MVRLSIQKKKAVLFQKKRISFTPNNGYAFPVSDCSWHGVEKIDAPNIVRNSLMVVFYHKQYLTEHGDINFYDPNVIR